MRDYKSIRSEWVYLRKIKSTDKIEVDFVKQAILGLIIDKTDKMFKSARKGNYDDYIADAIKSEYKQTIDALKQGVACQIQIGILEALMPKTLSEDETSELIISMIAKYDNPNMGMIMKDLKQVDSIDMQLASKLVKELL